MTFARDVWKYFKIDNPKEFRDYYEDDTIDRERSEQVVKAGKWNQLKNLWNWYPSYYSKYERKFLLKVDLTVLLFVTLSYYTKYLDSANVANAYVSGMKEELHITGNEYNYFTTFFDLGYLIFQIPLVLLVQRQKTARYLLIVCELVWGLCTFAASAARNAKDLYVIRFFVGMSEAVGYPAAFVIMSTWYTPEELIRRGAVYNMMSCVGSATSGLLQSACRETLSGVGGLSGWRWQFIIDGIITLGCTTFGLLLFPGTPETTKKFGILSEDDLVFARNRMRGKIALPQLLGKKIWKDVFSTWQAYLLISLWVLRVQIVYSSDLTLYIKSKIGDGYSASDPTLYSAAVNGAAAVSTLLLPQFSVVFGMLPIISLLFCVHYYALIVLVVWNTSEAVKISAYFMENIVMAMVPIFAVWTMILCRDSAEKKAVVLALMNTLSAATSAWLTPLQWNTKYSPDYHTAYRISLGFCVASHVVFFAVFFLDRYDVRWIPKLAGNRRAYDLGELVEVDDLEGEVREGEKKDGEKKADDVVTVVRKETDSI